MEMANKLITLYGAINGFNTGMQNISPKLLNQIP